jgi:general secretion pathway protein K
MLASKALQPQSPQAGFALIMVIWGIGILSLLMASVIITARYRIVSARNAVENAKAEALAEAGIGLLRLALSAHAASGSLAAEALSDQATPIVCAMPEGAVAALTVRDEGGKVDLNTAAPKLIAALLAGLGTDTAQSDKLARNIRDFSQRSPNETAYSVMAREYAALGLKHGPKRAPFETIYELGQVPGFTRQLLRSVLPLITVHSHAPGLDPKAADPDLLAAIARSQVAATGRELASHIPVEFITPSSRQAFAVRAEVRTPGGGRAATEAILTLSAGLLGSPRQGMAPRSRSI